MQVKVGTRWLSELGPWQLGDWSTELRGSEDLTLTTRPGRPHPYLVTGAAVELFDATKRVWKGRLDRPDTAGGELKATGLYRLAYDVPALDGGGAPTSVANTAVDAAISRGALPGWSRSNFLSTTAMSNDLQGEAPMIGDLLDLLADHEGKWWRVDADGEVDLFARPSTPRWRVTQDAGALGFSEAGYASTLKARHRDTGSGTGWSISTFTDTSAATQFGPRESMSDYGHMGSMTGARVVAVLTGQSQKGQGRFGFANGVTVSRHQILTNGGIPAHLPIVKGGDLARFMVQHDQTRFLNGRGHVEEVLGKVTHHPASETADIEPANLDAGAGSFVDTLAWFATRDHKKRRRRRK